MRAITLSLLLFSMIPGGCSTPVAVPPSPKKPDPNRAPQEGEKPAPSALEEFLTWLPPNTETLVVARGPFKVQYFEDSDEDSEDAEEVSLEETFQYYTLGSLAAIREGRFFKEMANWTVKLALEGSRKFRRPSGLGGFLYEGSDVILLEDKTPLDSFMKSIEKDAEAILEVQGHRVSVYREKLENDEWTFHVVRPKPNVLLCATNRGYLDETLRRITNSPKPRAFSADLPEWKLLNPDARVWAIRHYIRGEEDVYACSFKDDATAKGMVFFPSAEGRTGRVRILSESEDTFKEVAGSFHNPREGLTAETTHEKGVVEVRAKCVDPKSTSYFVFVLLAFLGHAIFV
jgi:hypothetical protein